jgi:hypothetical protein
VIRHQEKLTQNIPMPWALSYFVAIPQRAKMSLTLNGVMSDKEQSCHGIELRPRNNLKRVIYYHSHRFQSQEL